MRESELKCLFGGNRELAIQRDNERCVRCGMTREEHRSKYDKDLTVDHIDRQGSNVPVSQKNNHLDNLQTLCFPCHGEKSFIDSGRGRSSHGTPSMYVNQGCRCNDCRAAWASRMREYKRNRKLQRV